MPEPIPKLFEYWIAEVSYSKNNPVHRVIIQIIAVSDNYFMFVPFIPGENIERKNQSMNYFKLIRKIDIDK